MIFYANQASKQLSWLREWQELVVDGSQLIVADFPGQKEKAFPLPEDFYRPVNQTQWVSETQLPAVGPISYQNWQQYIVRNVQPVISMFWQIRNNQLWVITPPETPGQTLVYKYVTRGLVRDADDALLLKDTASKNGDIFLLEGQLVMLFALVKYQEAKGFDSTSATKTFNETYEARDGAVKGAPVLSMARSFQFPYINGYNVPDTSYGL
jgi:hypothetical protein